MNELASEIIDEMIYTFKDQKDPNFGPLITVHHIIQHSTARSTYDTIEIIYGGYVLKLIKYTNNFSTIISLVKLKTVTTVEPLGQGAVNYNYYSISVSQSDLPKFKELLYCMEDYMGKAFVPEVWEFVDKCI